MSGNREGSYGTAVVVLLLVGLVTIAAAIIVPTGLTPRPGGILAAMLTVLIVIIKIAISSGLTGDAFSVEKSAFDFAMALWIVVFTLTITQLSNSVDPKAFPAAAMLVRLVAGRDLRPGDAPANSQWSLVVICAATFVAVAVAFFCARFSLARKDVPAGWGVLTVRAISAVCGTVCYVLYVSMMMFKG